MKSESPQIGQMDASYAQERTRKPELIYRYQVRAEMVIQALRQHGLGKKNIRLLDLGSADGRTLREIYSHFPTGTYRGIELSKDLIQLAPPLPPGIKIIHGDITQLPEDIEDHNWDVICALAVLEHLPDPLLAVKQAKRKLRTGGLFIASCPHPFWETIATRMGLLQDDLHAVHLTKETFLGLFQQAGFSYLEYKRFMWAPFGILPYLKIPFSPQLSMSAETLISRLKVCNFLFVNQCIIAIN